MRDNDAVCSPAATVGADERMAHSVKAKVEDEDVDISGAAAAGHARQGREVQRLLHSKRGKQKHVVILRAKANHLLYVPQSGGCAVDGDAAAVGDQAAAQAVQKGALATAAAAHDRSQLA